MVKTRVNKNNNKIVDKTIKLIQKRQL